MDSVLRPRDIQARIRAGESLERVAEAAQTTTDRIMAFAAPVLAERAYVAQQAQKASVRRRAGDGPIGQLGDAVNSRLADQELRPDDVEWDAWRRGDGRWTLVAEYAVQGSPRRACFAYDAAGRYVVAEDDEARALVGERAGAADRTEQLPLGDDAIEVVTGRRPAPLAEEPTVDLTDAATAVRPAEPFSAAPVRPDPADWISTQASDRPAAEPAAPDAPAEPDAPDAPAASDAPDATAEPAEPAAAYEVAETAEAGTAAPAEAETLFDASALASDPPAEPTSVPAPEQAGQHPAEHPSEQADEQADQPAAEQAAEPRKRPKAKAKGRASVPSWDEIMFGSGRSEG